MDEIRALRPSGDSSAKTPHKAKAEIWIANRSDSITIKLTIKEVINREEPANMPRNHPSPSIFSPDFGPGN